MAQAVRVRDARGRGGQGLAHLRRPRDRRRARRRGVARVVVGDRAGEGEESRRRTGGVDLGPADDDRLVLLNRHVVDDGDVERCRQVSRQHHDGAGRPCEEVGVVVRDRRRAGHAAAVDGRTIDRLLVARAVERERERHRPRGFVDRHVLHRCRRRRVFAHNPDRGRGIRRQRRAGNAREIHVEAQRRRLVDIVVRDRDRDRLRGLARGECQRPRGGRVVLTFRRRVRARRVVHRHRRAARGGEIDRDLGHAVRLVHVDVGGRRRRDRTGGAPSPYRRTGMASLASGPSGLPVSSVKLASTLIFLPTSSAAGA